MALRLESGMNDVVLLPVVVLSILLLQNGSALPAGDMARHAIGLFLLGPALGGLVGWVGIITLARVRDRVGVRRDYESVYALGLAFTGYAAAEAVGGSGFLAAFAAGAVVAWQDVELCDCFLEYGEATAEMLLLLTFVALGMSLIWTGLTVITGRMLIFAAIALVARTAVLLPMLRGVGLGTRDRRLIALFGPRGLSSLLFALLPVFAGVAGAEHLFTVVCLVVLLSVVVHGGGIGLFLRANAAPARSAAAPAGTATAGTATAGAATAPVAAALPAAVPADRIELHELRELLARSEPVVILDARTERSYRADQLQARGAVRLPPDDAVRAATELRLSHHGTLVVYCA
jgi:NhaP-type Na+/H+ or K+/H+ antiporter